MVLDALTAKGLVLPAHSTQIGSSIASDNQYDQLVMLPEAPERLVRGVGVFDFDAVVFRELWERGNRKVFNEYVRYYLSDHRVMWVHLATQFIGD